VSVIDCPDCRGEKVMTTEEEIKHRIANISKMKDSIRRNEQQIIELENQLKKEQTPFRKWMFVYHSEFPPTSAGWDYRLEGWQAALRHIEVDVGPEHVLPIWLQEIIDEAKEC